MGEEPVRVCPHCDSPNVEFYTGEGSNGGESPRTTPHYQCQVCARRLDELAERERDGFGHGGHAKLKRAGFAHLLDDGGESE